METSKSLYSNNPFLGMNIAFILYNYKFLVREDVYMRYEGIVEKGGEN